MSDDPVRPTYYRCLECNHYWNATVAVNADDRCCGKCGSERWISNAAADVGHIVRVVADMANENMAADKSAYAGAVTERDVAIVLAVWGVAEKIAGPRGIF